MERIRYDVFAPRAGAGIIFLKLGYPASRLRSVITKTNFTHVGFYTASSEIGSTGVFISLVDVYSGLFTPSWYREGFILEDLLSDRLVERAVVKPYKGDLRKFQTAVLNLALAAPSYTLEQALREAFAPEPTLLRDTDLVLSLVACLEQETSALQVGRHETLLTCEELGCETRVFHSSRELSFDPPPETALVAETESALFLEKPLFQRLAQAFLKLIGEDAGFRRDVARQILLPSENQVLTQLSQILGREHELWGRVLASWDKGFVTGELRKSELRELLVAIAKQRQELGTYFHLENATPTLANLEVATTLTFDEISNTRETNLHYLHELVADIARQCREGVPYLTIPINSLIEATNRVSTGLTQLPPIPPLERGSYGALLTVRPDDAVALEAFSLRSGDIHLIPSHNANLDALSLEQLQELSQLLNTRRHSRIVTEHFQQLRDKVARTIAQRRAAGTSETGTGLARTEI